MSKWLKGVLIVGLVLAVGAAVAWGYIYWQERGQLSDKEVAAAVSDFMAGDAFTVDGKYSNDKLSAPVVFDANVSGENSLTTAGIPLAVAGKQFVLSAEVRVVGNKTYLKITDVDEALKQIGGDPLSRAIKSNLSTIAEMYVGQWMAVDKQPDLSDCISGISQLQASGLNSLDNLLAEPEYKKTGDGVRYTYQLQKSDLPAGLSDCLQEVDSLYFVVSFNESDEVIRLDINGAKFEAKISPTQSSLKITEPKSSLKFSNLEKSLESLFIQ